MTAVKLSTKELVRWISLGKSKDQIERHFQMSIEEIFDFLNKRVHNEKLMKQLVRRLNKTERKAEESMETKLGTEVVVRFPAEEKTPGVTKEDIAKAEKIYEEAVAQKDIMEIEYQETLKVATMWKEIAHRYQEKVFDQEQRCLRIRENLKGLKRRYEQEHEVYHLVYSVTREVRELSVTPAKMVFLQEMEVKFPVKNKIVEEVPDFGMITNPDCLSIAMKFETMDEFRKTLRFVLVVLKYYLEGKEFRIYAPPKSMELIKDILKTQEVEIE